MPRGVTAVPEQDPNKERVITWRVTGRIHRMITKITNKLRTSNNDYLTKIMKPHLEEKFKKEFPDDNRD